MAKSFLREITREDIEQAVDAALLLEHVLLSSVKQHNGLDVRTLGNWAAALLTRPEKTVYVDVDYKVVETTVKGETKNG